MARDGLKNHQTVTSTTAIMEKFQTEVFEMFTLMDVCSLACSCGILGLVVPEQKKGNFKLLLKCILRQFNSEDVEDSDDGSSSWYTKLHDRLRTRFPKKIMHLFCLAVTTFLKISLERLDSLVSDSC